MRAPLATRALIWFWLAILLIAGGGAATLQWLGPPARKAEPANEASSVGKPVLAEPHPARVEAGAPPAPAVASAGRTMPAETLLAHTLGVGRDTPGPISPPDTLLQERSPEFPGASLPRIAPDGRRPMQIYARGFDPADKRPRVGMLLSGFGLSLSASDQAVHTLPGPISLAVSPYALHPEAMLQAARDAGHELLIALPMEPQGYPQNSEGPHAMLTGSRPDDNRLQLEWALSRIDGYVGATGALDGLRGERFAGLSNLFAFVLRDLAARGLLYVDPRAGQPPPPLVFGRSVDLVVDEPPTKAEITTKLARLSQIAHERGSALGLAGVVRPVTLEAIAVWANSLDADGLALAPVSALVQPPPPPVQSQAAPQ